MSSVLLVAHIFLAIALVIVVLLQRSESGSLGSIGGGGNSGAVAPLATSANPLWRVTSILGALFMLTSLALALTAAHHSAGGSLLDKLQTEAKPLAAKPVPGLPGVAPSPAAAPARAQPATPTASDMPSVPLAATTARPDARKPIDSSAPGKVPSAAKASPAQAPSVPVGP